MLLRIREDLGPSLFRTSPAELPTHNNREKGDYSCNLSLKALSAIGTLISSFAHPPYSCKKNHLEMGTASILQILNLIMRIGRSSPGPLTTLPCTLKNRRQFATFITGTNDLFWYKKCKVTNDSENVRGTSVSLRKKGLSRPLGRG